MTKSPSLELPVDQAWRFERLVDLGFKLVHAEDLVERPDVEHAARELLDKGCTTAVAYRILRD